jgi:hypothetical protein
MNKTFLSICLIIVGFSSLSAMEAPVQSISVDRMTFMFVVACREFLKQPEDAGFLAEIGMLYDENPAKISEGLGRIDSDLGNVDFSHPTQEIIQGLEKLLCEKEFNIQSGKYLLELGPSFPTNKAKILQFIPEPPASTDHNPKIHKNHELYTIMSMPLFKASCAATAAGIATYCALRFYNKDKAKEQHYSPIKWSLGAAAVAGAGTYWYVR